MFFNARENMEIHSVPRLLFLLEGTANFSYIENDYIFHDEVSAPCIFYCSNNGYLMNKNKYKQRMLSFSYYPGYIRAMHVNFDGINQPPTELDVFFHTLEPLPEAGMKLLETIDKMHENQYDTIAEQLLEPLLEMTIKYLETSQATSVKQERPLWSQINTFLREHRSDPLSRSQVAKLFVISPGYLSQLCREYAGKSFSALKLQYQFEYAVNLMFHSRLTIDEIAQQSGFSGSNYFIRRFKRQYGTTPNHYRNHRKKD